ncbi:MAG: hypothetical protein JW699_00105, partial [Chitinispirillaceae bacterium]|nr:hypothetical protein [Chitinispirillaceae bacterium]
MKLNKSILTVLLCAGALWPQARDFAGQEQVLVDSATVAITETGIDEPGIWRQDSVRRFNPFVAGAVSMALPGAGQVY